VRKSRFNEEQIIAILKEAEAGIAPDELCRRHGITRGSLYRWKAKYGGMEVSEARRLRTPSNVVPPENTSPKTGMTGRKLTVWSGHPCPLPLTLILVLPAI
jgi:transposase-like protein